MEQIYLVSACRGVIIRVATGELYADLQPFVCLIFRIPGGDILIFADWFAFPGRIVSDYSGIGYFGKYAGTPQAAIDRSDFVNFRL